MQNDPTTQIPGTKKPAPETPDAQNNRNTWGQTKMGMQQFDIK